MKTMTHTDHRQLVPYWERAMLGGLSGWSYSNRTVADYKYHIGTVLGASSVLTLQTFEECLLTIPVERFATREKFYKAILCFAKYLVDKGLLEPSFLASLRKYRPRRVTPPKRYSVKNDALEKIRIACKDSADIAIIQVLANTGIRASELCQLSLDDIDLDARTLVVQRGKWGKSRTLGLNTETTEALRLYLQNRKAGDGADTFFVNHSGKTMTRHGLHKRLQSIGNRAGVKVHAHALRRSFVTRNANLGRPLQMLQIACGHSNIQTTRGYCMTTEEEVIAQMRTW